MQTLIFLLGLLCSSQAFAMNDFDRAILFGANAASMGTYIAQMEGEMERIRLSYEKKAAEFKLKMEQEHQAYLKVILQEDLKTISLQITQYAVMQQGLKQRNEGFNQIVGLAANLYKGLVKKDSLILELHRLNEEYPGAENEWISLMKISISSDDIQSLTADEYEPLLMESLRIFSDSSALEKQIIEHIKYLEVKILSVQKRIQGMP